MSELTSSVDRERPVGNLYLQLLLQVGVKGRLCSIFKGKILGAVFGKSMHDVL